MCSSVLSDYQVVVINMLCYCILGDNVPEFLYNVSMISMYFVVKIYVIQTRIIAEYFKVHKNTSWACLSITRIHEVNIFR